MRRERLTVVLALLALGGVVVLASTQSFVRAEVTGVRGALTVQGSAVVPALAPLGIVLLALAAALTIAGRVARVLLGVVLALLGAATVAVALPAVTTPVAGVRGAARTATGVTGVDGLIHDVAATGWPTVAVAAGAIAVLLGVAVLVRGRRWPVGGSRYRASEVQPASTDPVDEWDALTRGADPTE